MANKTYIEFPAGTATLPVVILIADPATGALTQITLQQLKDLLLPGLTELNDERVMFNQLGNVGNNANFTYSYGGNILAILGTGRFTIGGAPQTSAQITMTSTTRGFLPPRMTTTQKNAISSPATGLVVFDTTLNKLCVRVPGAWQTITSA